MSSKSPAEGKKPHNGLTAREYMKIAEYRKKAEEYLKTLTESYNEKLQPVFDMLNRFKNSGVFEAAQKAQKMAEEIIRRQNEISYFLVPPQITIPKPVEKHLSQYDIKMIASEMVKIMQKEKRPEFELFLNADGDLYSEPKEKHCYPFRKEKKRFEIFNLLLLSKGRFVKTSRIATATGSSEETVRAAIGKIKHNAKILLDLQEDLIISKSYDGYRINPVYTITRVRE